MLRKRIRINNSLRVTSIIGTEWNTPELDEDGELRREDPGDLNSRIATIKAYPSDLFRAIILSIPPQISRKMDYIRVIELWDQLQRSLVESNGETITLKQNAYEWLHKALDRPMNNGKGGEYSTYGTELFGINALWIQEQLTDETRRRTFEAMARQNDEDEDNEA